MRLPVQKFPVKCYTYSPTRLVASPSLMKSALVICSFSSTYFLAVSSSIFTLKGQCHEIDFPLNCMFRANSQNLPLSSISNLMSLSEQSHEIFKIHFFPQIAPFGPIRDVFGPFQILVIFHRDICIGNCPESCDSAVSYSPGSCDSAESYSPGSCDSAESYSPESCDSLES